MPAYAARAPRKESEVQWTQEDKDRYTEQWKTFRKKFAKVQQGQARDLTVKLVEITEPKPVTSTYQGVTTTKPKRQIIVQCVDAGIDMIRLYAYSADNPFFHKTMLNNVLRALGVFPKEEEGLDIEFEDFVGRTLIATVQKGGERTDGKYAGFYTNVIAYKPSFEDDDDEEEEAPAPAPKRATKQAPAAPVEDRAPWEDEGDE